MRIVSGKLPKKNKRIIGDFVWAGWDYIGEVGDGAAEYSDYKFEDEIAGIDIVVDTSPDLWQQKIW